MEEAGSGVEIEVREPKVAGTRSFSCRVDSSCTSYTNLIINQHHLAIAYQNCHTSSSTTNMALKRKRSSATISSPASIASDATQSASPPPYFFQQSQPVELSHKPTWSLPTYEYQPQHHLNSRTRKRYRNNRPDEEAVYGVSCWLGAVITMSSLADVCRIAASTIEKLYAAQKQLPLASPVCSSNTTTPPPEPTELPTQRTTLHSFWRLPQAPPSTSMMMDCAYDTDISRDTSCDDDDSMDIDESFVDRVAACQSCQRQIQGRYTAIGNLRVCITCASSAYR